MEHALEQGRTLFELDAYIRPMSDLAVHLAGATDWPPWDGRVPGSATTSPFAGTS
jgi:hypothetical protein